MQLSDDAIYVTGMGCVSAIGLDMTTMLHSLLHSRSGIGSVKYLDTSLRQYPAGEVDCDNAALALSLGCSGAEASLRTVLLGIHAGREALKNSRLADLSHTAFINGTTVGGMDNTERIFTRIHDDKDDEATRRLEYNDCGCVTRLTADSLGQFAMISTLSTACSSAANAIIHGADLIKSGRVDSALSGGSECLSRFHFNGFNSLMILNADRCRPFSADTAGINLGEGAAYLVLERGSDVKRRGIRPLARLSGYANRCDAYHQTAMSDNGEGPFLAMTAAIDNAGLTPRDISYINAHGTGTRNNDTSELRAMKRIWGDNLPPYSSTKSLTGHTTSASGAIEAVICILALQHGFLPAGPTGRTPLDATSPPLQAPVEATARHILCNSFGFGGNDSSLIFSSIEP